MANWAEKTQISINDKSFSISEAWVLVSLLSEHGVSPDALLHDSAIELETLYDPQSRISLNQQLSLQANGLRLGGLAGLGLVAGERLHLTAYGIVGYAMLSSPTLDDALRIAQEYSPLLNMKFEITYKVSGDEAIMTFGDIFDLNAGDRALCLELEIAKTITLLRDLLGEEFKPCGICVDFASESVGQWCQNLFGCEVFCDAAANQIRFHAKLLTRPLPQAHTVTNRSCIQVCDGMMEGLTQARELPHHIKRMLLDADGGITTLAEVANQLCMSPRTLRRRLESLNTSYVKILEDVRKTFAIRYLSSTALTTEVIAERLGYSDAANFRHAFKRWTGHSPRQFRLGNSSARCDPRAGLPQSVNSSKVHAGDQALRKAERRPLLMALGAG